MIRFPVSGDEVFYRITLFSDRSGIMYEPPIMHQSVVSEVRDSNIGLGRYRLDNWWRGYNRRLNVEVLFFISEIIDMSYR
jgi:hypothetical protein